MTFVITTPLYYVNDKPHLGSVYTTIICDSIARYKRLLGEDVIFITGVDEHGLKIQRTANEKGIEPKSHCDEITEIFNVNWKNWNISFDKFKYLKLFFMNQQKTYYKIIFVKWINQKRNIALVYFPDYSLEILITLFVSIEIYSNKIYKIKYNINESNKLEFIY